MLSQPVKKERVIFPLVKKINEVENNYEEHWLTR